MTFIIEYRGPWGDGSYLIIAKSRGQARRKFMQKYPELEIVTMTQEKETIGGIRG